MATVTGLTAARMLDIEAASIVEAEVDGDNLILKNHAGVTVLTANVRGPAGPTGATGQSGGVGSGGYFGTLQDAVNEVKAYSDTAGLGLVAMAEYSADDQLIIGGANTWHSVTNVTPSYSFVSGRSYRIDFGVCVQMGAGSTADNDIDIELREASSVLRRVSVKGTTVGRTSAATGTHILKSCPWSGSKTLNMRIRKREEHGVLIYNTFTPAYIAITDLGNRFA